MLLLDSQVRYVPPLLFILKYIFRLFLLTFMLLLGFIFIKILLHYNFLFGLMC